jgi:hypothetical protein
MRKAAKLALSMGGAAGLIGATANPAGADWIWQPETGSTTGAEATCQVRTETRYVHDDIAQINCAITDTQADGDAVYVAWKQDGYATISLYNRQGNGWTTYHEDRRYNPDGSFFHLRWRICRDRQAPFSDNCSDWFDYYTGSAK